MLPVVRQQTANLGPWSAELAVRNRRHAPTNCPAHRLRQATWLLIAFFIGCAAATAGPEEPAIGVPDHLAPVISADTIRARQSNVQVDRTAAVVCAPAMLPILEPWKRIRERQGIEIVHVDSRLDTPEIRRQLQQLARQRPLRYVLLVGDANTQMAFDSRVREISVPTFYYEATIIKRWGPEQVIATDNPFGDLDGDGVPEIAVGRLTAETPTELQQIVDKILYYESLPANGTWRRRIHFTAGVGDFGPITDAVVETAAKRFITDGIPADYRVKLAYGSWRSPYCPDPRAFRESVLSSIQEGCLFWVYMGHGRPYRLDRIQFGDSVLPILETGDIPRMNAQAGLPIALMMACYAGAFDQPMDCVAERMLRTPGGPVAVVCGTRVSMPYAMSILGTALMDAYFEEHIDTLGDALLFAKRELASENGSDITRRKLLDTMACALNPGKDELTAERIEHQLIFNLLGDPTLRLRHPASVELDCESAIEAGDKLQVQGSTPIGGKCLVELCCRRDGFTFAPSRRRQIATTDDELIAMSQTYQRANNRVWTSVQLDLQPGPFHVELPVPKHARGFSHARVFVQNGNGYATGSSQVYIQSADTQTELRQSNADR